ncbi:LysM peptidoglycan-binding domain-containing protein [Nostocoides sp. F2B08]|uniref:LysM peptidoglycan-binding domain-containing protein n=1 Tax=Nostocoides sp. F2B08 TaxID=2653936 RepID=UPI0012634B77|nr:LysM peptidoglycan-binding domain-containing protein [Tetrasphaera sp. F2B08]KAB7740346.1 LysM peptidoglycan-binding domain-containing protein [Tetrasphaera sp. F2B08]
MNIRARLVGLLATLATLVLVAGVPTALVAFAGNPLPDTIPTFDTIRTALTIPDDGTLLLAVITWIAWIAWAVLTLAVLLEVAARLRGVHAPQLPGLALPQGAAAQLVGAATLLFLVAPPSIATAHATPAQPVPAVTAPLTPTATAPGWTQAGASADAVTAPPAAESSAAAETYTVRRGDSLSRIAAEHLGDGDRWPELVDLNPALANDPDLIYAGTVITLPSAAHPSSAFREGRTYVVRAGDTLSSIAERELGDAELYPLIYEASRDIPQPGGTFLRDPDVIDIGWRLNVSPPPDQDPPPVDKVPPATEQVPPPEGAVEPDPGVESDGKAQSSPGGVVAGESSPRRLDRSDPENRNTLRPHTPEVSTAYPSESAAEARDEDSAGDPSWLVLGLTGAGTVLAGSMLTLLRRRRRAAVRYRRPGYTLAAPDPALAPIEKTVTVVGAGHAPAVEHLDLLLRRLAASHARTQTPLPALAAVKVSVESVTLVLTAPADLPDPWRAGPDRQHWQVPFHIPLDDMGVGGADQPAPWPLLATIGMDEDGAHWMLNLEGRHLAITGDHTFGLDLARYLAAEAATNPWAGAVTLDLVGVAPELSGLDPDRIRAHTDEGAGGDAIGACLVDAIAAIDRARDTGRDPVTARTAPDEPDAWPARLLLVDAATRSPVLEQLLDLLRDHPAHTATSVIVTAATSPGEASTVLQVSAQGRVGVPDLGLDLVAVGLTADEAHGCAALLAHSSDPADADVPTDDTTSSGWQVWADQAGALRAEHTLPRHPTAPTRNGADDGPLTDSLLQRADQTYVTVGATTSEDLTRLAPRIKKAVRSGIEAGDPSLDDDVAMWFRTDSALPKLRLLGPVRVTAHGTPPTRRKPYYSELLTFIALHPNGATAEELTTAFGITNVKSRDYVTTLRAWLGTNPRTGEPHLPDARKAPGVTVRGAPVYQVLDLLTDADLFRRLRTRGQARGADGITDLTTALRLVTGRPFDYPPEREAAGGWAWLIGGDRHDEHLRVAIVDVAHIVTTHALAEGDLATARRAAQTARLAAPDEEIPRLDLAAVAAAAGQDTEARRIIRDEVCNRSDDDGAPMELPVRTAAVLRERAVFRQQRAGWDRRSLSGADVTVGCGPG